MQNHNDDTIRRATQFLEKYTSHFIWKGCVWEGVRDRTELQLIDPHSYGHQRFFTVLLSCSTGSLGPSLSGCWFSLPHLISNWSLLQLVWSPTGLIPNWLNFLCTELYDSSTSTFFLWTSQIALIQPVHGQGYILIFLNRMHFLFTQVHFLFW